MNKLHSMTPVAALLALSVTGTTVQAAENQAAPASTPHQMSKAKDGKCGEAKCGAAKKAAEHKKAADAKCGAAKKQQMQNVVAITKSSIGKWAVPALLMCPQCEVFYAEHSRCWAWFTT